MAKPDRNGKENKGERKDLGNFRGMWHTGFASHFRAGGSRYSKTKYNPLNAFLPGHLAAWIPHVIRYWFHKKHPFRDYTTPGKGTSIFPMADRATLSLVGDWGTGTEGKPFDRHNLSRRQLKATCKKLGVEGVSWHWLRHANATLLDPVGPPLGTVQSLLGHSSPEITRGIYLHSLPAGAKEAVQKVEDLLTGPKRTQVLQTAKPASLLIQ